MNSAAAPVGFSGYGGKFASRMTFIVVQPFLSRLVHKIALQHPSLFARLGGHQATDYLVDPVELPFALHLRLDPKALILPAAPRDATPRASAIIRGRFTLLLELVDSEADGDVAFFSREMDIGGDIEALVRLRKALDDMDGSVVEQTANMFGPPGRAILARLRRSCATAPKGSGAK